LILDYDNSPGFNYALLYKINPTMALSITFVREVFHPVPIY
jgi:hypothetical protein